MNAKTIIECCLAHLEDGDTQAAKTLLKMFIADDSRKAEKRRVKWRDQKRRQREMSSMSTADIETSRAVVVGGGVNRGVKGGKEGEGEEGSTADTCKITPVHRGHRGHRGQEPMSLSVLERSARDRTAQNGKPLNEWQARVQNLQAILENLCGRPLDTRKDVISLIRTYSNDVEGIIALLEGIDVSWADHPMAAIRKELKRRADRKTMVNASMFDEQFVTEVKDDRELCESGCLPGKWCPAHRSKYRDKLTAERAAELAEKFSMNEERIEVARDRWENGHE